MSSQPTQLPSNPYIDGGTLTGAGTFTNPVRSLGGGASADGILPKLWLTGHITPAALPAGTTDDWNPPGLDDVTIVRVVTDPTGSTLGGLVPPNGPGARDGRYVVLVNHGDGSGSRGVAPLTMLHRSAGSSAFNRFVMPDLTDLELPYTGCAILSYEGDGFANGSWIVHGTSTGNFARKLTTGDQSFVPIFPPALAAGNNNDYEPAGWEGATLVVLTTNTGGVLTGLKYYGSATPNNPQANGTYQCGYYKILVNRSGSAAPIKITNEDPASSIENRFTLPAGDFWLPGGESLVVVYDFSSGRWRPVCIVGFVSKLTTSEQFLDTLGNGNNNNWSPPDFASIGHRKVQVGVASVITGMVAQETGAIRTLVAFGTFTLTNQDANSAGPNQLYLPAAYQAGGLVLNAGDSVTLRYDAALTLWTVVALAR